MEEEKFLEGLRKRGDGMKMPDGYLEQFEDRLMQRIQSEGVPRQRPGQGPRPSRKPSLIQMWMAAAATVVALVAGIWFWGRPALPDSSDQAQPLAAYEKIEISGEDAEAWLQDNVQEFEAQDLATITPEETTEPAESQHNTPQKPDIRAEDVEHLLDEMSEEEIEEML